MWRRFAALLAVAAWIAAHPSPASAFWLLWTNPSRNALVVDTTLFDCSGGDSLRDLSRITVVVVPATGGPSDTLASLSRIGREGTRDSTWVSDSLSGHFFTIAWDLTGNPSCASNEVYHGPTTGVPLPEQRPSDARKEADPVTRCEEVDAAGRKVTPGQEAWGKLYWRVYIHASGRREAHPYRR